jgi:hypothetical protein
MRSQRRAGVLSVDLRSASRLIFEATNAAIEDKLILHRQARGGGGRCVRDNTNVYTHQEKYIHFFAYFPIIESTDNRGTIAQLRHRLASSFPHFA